MEARAGLKHLTVTCRSVHSIGRPLVETRAGLKDMTAVCRGVQSIGGPLL